MFKNFDKVFKFSFKNQALTKSFKGITFVIAALLFFAPPVIMLIISYNINNTKELKACGAERVYVVNETPGDDSFFDSIKKLGVKDYTDIDYIVFDNYADAISKSSGDSKCFVLLLDSNNGLNANIVIPSGSEVKKSSAKNYLKFIDKHEDFFTAGLSGLDSEEIEKINLNSEYKTYTETGLKNNLSMDEDTERSDEITRDQVSKVFSMAIPYATIMLLYFMIVTFGQTLAQSIVMEKESKLMDTMLVSVKPESLVFGKFLSTIVSMLTQIGVWLLSIVLGFALGNVLVGKFFPDTKLALTVFFDGMKDINVFRPWNVALAVLFLILGMVLYLSMATIAGAMSTSKEDVSSKSSLFIFPLVGSFLAIIAGGGMNAETVSDWMLIFPFTAAMLMPADVSLGSVSGWVIAVSIICFVFLVIVLIIAAGRIYKMMSLYKGNKLSISDVLKRTFSKT